MLTSEDGGNAVSNYTAHIPKVVRKDEERKKKTKDGAELDGQTMRDDKKKTEMTLVPLRSFVLTSESGASESEARLTNT